MSFTTVLSGFIMSLFGWSAVSRYGAADGIRLVILAWSCVQLYIPISRGRLLIGLPLEKLFGIRTSIFIPLIAWSLGLIIAGITLYAYQDLYFCSATTHFLHFLVNNRSPGWYILGICALEMVWSVAANYAAHNKISPTVFRSIHLILIVGVMYALFALCWQELVIILNTHGIP